MTVGAGPQPTTKPGRAPSPSKSCRKIDLSVLGGQNSREMRRASSVPLLTVLVCGLAASPAAADLPLDATPAKSPAAKGGKEARVTFAGFVSHDDGSSTIFVEITDSVAVEFSQKERTATYTLRGAMVPLRNNRRPLLTREFDSAVMSARLVSDKKAKTTRLIVELREAVTPTHKMVARGQGFALEVNVPAPKAAK